MQATFTHLIGPRKGERKTFDADTISIGRAPDNMLCLGDDERRVSSHHAEIRRRGDHFVLHDLGSTNGTMINGRRVITSEIHEDDLLEFGAGGPLLRLGIESDGEIAAAAHVSDNDHLMSQSAVEKLVERAFHNRISNRWLIVALVAAMAIGAVAGIWLSPRLDPSRRGEMSFAAVAARNHSAVVFIRTEFELVEANGHVTIAYARTGSGFVVSRDGLVVTNRHVVRDWEYNKPAPGLTGRATKIEVVFPGQKSEEAITATVHRLTETAETDLAILKIDPPSDLSIIYGLESDLEHTKQGDEVAVIGYPLGMDLLRRTGDDRLETSLSTGVVSRVSRDFIQLYLRAYNGNSGGPVLNRRGRVIGILTANVGSAQDIAFCIPVDAALKMLGEESRYSDSKIENKSFVERAAKGRN
ncbi:MAG: trypsin-like peptidase domain-containing protein [Blastocatellia bacterium]|nr:trypsin-like peptidase domain-containing protein [Blastocatellia bacterium]